MSAKETTRLSLHGVSPEGRGGTVQWLGGELNHGGDCYLD